MAGRGREATLPAWMTEGDHIQMSNNNNVPPHVNGQYDDAQQQYSRNNMNDNNDKNYG